MRRYLLLLLLPVILLIGLYTGVRVIITRQMDEVSTLTINQFYLQATAMLNEMDTVYYNLQNNSVIKYGLDNPDNASIDQSIMKDEILSCMVKTPCVQHVWIISETDGTIYSDQGCYTSASLSAILHEIGLEYDQVQDTFLSTDPNLSNSNSFAPYSVYTLTSLNGTKIGTVIATLQMSEFLTIFSDLNAEFCSIYNDNFYITSYLLNIDMESFDWSEKMISDLVGESLHCTTLNSDTYTYIVGISKERFNLPLKFILIAFGLYFSLVIVLGYLYLYYVSKKRYKSIEALINTLPESSQNANSIESLYDNIRGYLQKYNADYQRQINLKQEQRLRELIFSKLDKISSAQFCNAGFPAGGNYCYYVAAFFTKHIEDPNLQLENMIDVIEYVNMLFRSTLTELVSSRNLNFAFCCEHNIYIAVFYSNVSTENLKEDVKDICDSVISLLTGGYELNIQAITSTQLHDPVEIPKAFQECVTLHQFSESIKSRTTTISVEDFQENSSVLLSGDFIRQEQMLINTILAKKYGAVPPMVNAIINVHISQIGNDYIAAQYRLNALRNVLIEGIRMSSMPDSTIEKYVNNIIGAQDVQQLIRTTNAIYQHLSAFSKSTSEKIDLLNAACEYIDQNLADPNLNVAVICDSVKVSSQKLTQLFQKNFDMAIAEYVNAQRIEKFKKLLIETDEPVNQIIGMVGYTNTDTSTRNFKKFEGITPGEYRRLNKV